MVTLGQWLEQPVSTYRSHLNLSFLTQQTTTKGKNNDWGITREAIHYNSEEMHAKENKMMIKVNSIIGSY